MGKALVVVCLLATSAFAQPARLQLADGRVVDGHITGGDTASYFVQTPQGYFSIARAQVVAVTPLFTTPPPPEARTSSRFGPNVRIAVGTYLLTATIALARTTTDDDASYGLIPIAGPLLWAGRHDDDKFFEDGWDWLALGSTVVQSAGLLGIFTSKRVSDNSLVQVMPAAARSYGGIAVVGQW